LSKEIDLSSAGRKAHIAVSSPASPKIAARKKVYDEIVVKNRTETVRFGPQDIVVGGAQQVTDEHR
jgi:hypothetical protein